MLRLTLSDETKMWIINRIIEDIEGRRGIGDGIIPTWMEIIDEGLTKEM